MVEPGAVKPLGNFTAQESLVDSLLQQFTQVSNTSSAASGSYDFFSGRGEDSGGEMELGVLICAWSHV